MSNKNLFFDFLNDLSFGKEMILTDDNKSKYQPYVVNEIYSRFTDTIFHAEELNNRPNMSKRGHYLYLIHALKKRKRFGKMSKGEKPEHFDTVKEYYKYSDKKTEEVFNILTSDQINSIVKMMDKGGIK